MSKNTKVINIYAGAGAGKTTLALELSAELKKRYKGSVEYIPEYVKNLILHGKEKELKDQEKISKAQSKMLLDLVGKVDIIVTDSPIELGRIYVSSELQKNAVNKIIDDCVSKYKSVDFFLHRDEWRKYETFGRIHTEEESKKIDERILKELNKDFIHIDNNTSIDSIINKLDLEPNKLKKSIKPLDLNSYSEYEITNALNKLDYEKLVKTMILYEKSDDFKYGGFKYAEETLQIAYDKFLNDDNFTRIMSEEFSDIIDEAYEYVKEKNKEKQKEKIIPLKEKYPDR